MLCGCCVKEHSNPSAFVRTDCHGRRIELCSRKGVISSLVCATDFTLGCMGERFSQGEAFSYGDYKWVSLTKLRAGLPISPL